MVEIFLVALFGAGLAWLQAHSREPEPLRVDDATWERWEHEIHNWVD